jgi:hypothetical protein
LSRRFVAGPLATAAVLAALMGDPEVRTEDSMAIQRVVDTHDPGENLPPAGRSLFDFLTMRREGSALHQHVPFPFTDLVGAIEGATRADPAAPLRRVLIPLGRSLQRAAAKPDFFDHPRVVLAVDREPSERRGESGMLLKDRLYVGYQEAAAVLEVISYNEASGRFEFQVVRDYRPGGMPKVAYANRALCTACHQNQAAIFSRPLWEETNGNPQIASLLRSRERDFYGVPIDEGVDVPLAIDSATDRANLYSAYQRLWREGCGADPSDDSTGCRASAFLAVLQYRLSGSRSFDRGSERYKRQLGSRLTRMAAALWGGGLQIPSADLPNRNPLTEVSQPAPIVSVSSVVGREASAVLSDLIRQSSISPALEPLAPRPPLETWFPATDQGVADRLVRGLAEFIAEADVRELDRLLFAGVGAVGSTRYQSPCEVIARRRGASFDRVRFRCAATGRKAGGAPFRVEGRAVLDDDRAVAGVVNGLAMEDSPEEIHNLEVAGGAVDRRGDRWRLRLQLAQADSGLHVRRADGSAVQALEVDWPRSSSGSRSASGDEVAATGGATLTVGDDFRPITEAVEAIERAPRAGASDAFSAKPFRRASAIGALRAALGLPGIRWCCEDASGMPPPRADGEGAQNAASNQGTEEALPALRPFFRYCASCHRTADRFPPNFLAGSADEVVGKLSQCAERIDYRLGMWRLAPAERPKTPMPPTAALERLHLSSEEWPDHADLRALREYVRGILDSERSRASRSGSPAQRPYEQLRPCLWGS